MKVLTFLFLYILVSQGLTAELTMSNMSVRAWAGRGESTLIGGFALKNEYRLLIRAVGPGLAPFNVPGFCRDPRFRIIRMDDNTTIAENDNWASNSEIESSFSRVGAFPLVRGSADSALVITLAAGRYSVIVDPDQEGVVLFEVYDLDPFVNNGFTNLSVRTVIRPDGGIVIPGIAISGFGKNNFMFRAVGPGLAQFGVRDYCPDPRMTVIARIPNFGGDVEFRFPTVDNWNGTAGSDSTFTRIGAFPLGIGSKDAVFILPIDFQGGGQTFTAVVDGVDGCSGVVILEVWRY